MEHSGDTNICKSTLESYMQQIQDQLIYDTMT